MAEALVPGETLDWPTFSRFKFEIGDIVFIYVSSPVCQLTGKLEIEDNHLDFSEANPRNDLRKWPKTHSRIPWMRLRVLQCAPIPFKPLQRGSLYYHTEFKPSPYPKLLHEGEIEYVLRAFDEAASYERAYMKYDGGINPVALERVVNGTQLGQLASRIADYSLAYLNYVEDDERIELGLRARDGSLFTLAFIGVLRCHWEHNRADRQLSGLRIDFENTYLLTNIDGADIEVLSDKIIAN